MGAVSGSEGRWDMGTLAVYVGSSRRIHLADMVHSGRAVRSQRG